jgi:heptaprenylglyceryl phosphate synthase
VQAGADFIVTGTGVEKSENVAAFVREITSAIKGR